MTEEININILIIASSDLESLEWQTPFNLWKDIKNLPCDNYLGYGKKCKRCSYTKYEHKIGYPVTPLNPTVTEEIKIGDKTIKLGSDFSDFWRGKYLIFEKIKNMATKKQQKNLVITYETLDPLYKMNKKYLPIINKINTRIAQKLKIKDIRPGKKHIYPMYLDKLKTNKQYNMIIVLSGGFGWLFTPRNLNIIHKLLHQGGLLGHMYNKRIPTRYSSEFEFNSPISMCAGVYLDKLSADQKKCITNYSKMFLSNKFRYLECGIYIKH